MTWKHAAVALLAAALGAALLAAQSPPPVELELRYPDGTPVAWERWIGAHAPVAMVVWASWTPRSGEVLRRLGELRRVAEDRGLSLVLVAVQEPVTDSRRALEGVDVTWFHDGRGSVLKRFRVVRVPSLVVLDRGGRVLGRMESSPEALGSWEGR